MSALSIVVEDAVTALRRAVFAHGFQPIAIWNYDYVDPYVTTPGKQPFGRVWQATRGVQRLDERATNTGVLTRDLRTIDIDFDDERAGTVRAIAEECLGQTPLVRFRANSQRRLLVFRGFGRKINIDDAGGKHWVEVQGDGQQFVAFGRHPSGAELEWEDDNAPDCFAYADLPEVSENSIDRFVQALCEEFSFLHRAGQIAESTSPTPAEIVPFTRPTSTAAEAWAQAALEDETRKVATCGEGGRNDALNSAAYSLGQIVAGGYLLENDVINALRNAAASCGLPRDRGGWPAVNRTIHSGLTSGKREPRAKPELAPDPILATVAEVAAAMTSGKPKTDVPALPIDLGAGVDWTRPAGLLAEIAEWIMETSPMPNRPLAVAAAAAVISTVCGRHLYAPSGTSLVVYIAMLAKTGVGKDRPLNAPAEILHASGLGALSKSGKTFAVSGLENMIVDSPCCLATTDEIGVNLLARISHKRASTHEQAIKGTFLELWSRVYGKAPFMTTQRAGANSVSVYSPSYTLFGASTPDQFYKALEGGDVANGFMNRFLIAEAAPVADEDEDVDLTPVPQVIVDTLIGIVPEPDGNLGGLLGVFTALSRVEERKMEWADDGVRDAVRAFKKQVRVIVAETPLGDLWSRTYEYAIRLGAIHAVSRAGPFAKIGIGDMAWGAAWAVASARTMADAAENLMARSSYESDLNDVKKAIRSAGTVTRSNLLRTIRHLDARNIENITNHLADAGIIEKLETKPEGLGRPTRLYRWKG